MLNALAEHHNPLLSYGLIHGWIDLSGSREAAVRSFPTVCAAGIAVRLKNRSGMSREEPRPRHKRESHHLARFGPGVFNRE